jgi:hypothetical protein
MSRRHQLSIRCPCPLCSRMNVLFARHCWPQRIGIVLYILSLLDLSLKLVTNVINVTFQQILDIYTTNIIPWDLYSNEVFKSVSKNSCSNVVSQVCIQRLHVLSRDILGDLQQRINKLPDEQVWYYFGSECSQGASGYLQWTEAYQTHKMVACVRLCRFKWSKSITRPFVPGVSWAARRTLFFVLRSFNIIYIVNKEKYKI